MGIPAVRNINPNGGHYFNGTIYLTVTGNEVLPNDAAGVYAVNTKTYQTTPMINSFYGLRSQSVDNFSWVKLGISSCIGTGPNLFFFTLDLRPDGVTGAAPLCC